MTDTGAALLALDIGTRTVIGLVARADAGGLRVRSATVEEHAERAMYQGQIHDVEMVAATVSRVKRTLEKRLGQKLDRAAVAAAGRSLRTRYGQAEVELTAAQALDREHIQALQLEAVQQARQRVDQVSGNSNEEAGFMCVGFSPVRFFLNGEPITSLVGQKGEAASVEVIATFLPRVVVDSLLAVLDRCGLALESMTLEPIAALEVALEPAMRGLNLALVDVGAGTSDIALSHHGNVIAFGMVPQAGDHITEALSHSLLLDFHTAESVKKQLALGEDPLEFRDALGNARHVPAGEAQELLAPATTELARAIAGTIRELNQKPPEGVLLIGGGSRSPGLAPALAQALELPGDRVGIRTRETLKGIRGQNKRLSGPEAVTPLGIARWALRQPPLHYRRVQVNHNPVYLWNLQGTAVADALMAAGTGRSHLFPRPGDPITVERDGEVVIVPGKPGSPCQVWLNGKSATLDTAVQDGDRVELVPPQDGEPAKPRVLDLLAHRTFPLFVNRREVHLPIRVWLNGREVTDFSQPVPDRARIETRAQQPVAAALAQAGWPSSPETQTMEIWLNGRKQLVQQSQWDIRVNGELARPETEITEGDQITVGETGPAPTAGELLPEDLPQLTVLIDEQPLAIPCPVDLSVDGEPAGYETQLHQGAQVDLKLRDAVTVEDLLKYYDPREYGNGRRLKLFVNGQGAGFTSAVRHGDRVEFVWE